MALLCLSIDGDEGRTLAVLCLSKDAEDGRRSHDRISGQMKFYCPLQAKVMALL